MAPYFVDWMNYRSNFEVAASKILGQPVKVEGKASARLLPFPSVTFENVRVGNDPLEPDITIAQFSMDAELAPFLRGEVLIFDMRIDRPRLFARVSPDHKLLWSLKPQAPKGVESVKVESLTISDGAIEIDDQSTGRLVVVDAINANVSADSLTGPWRFAGGMNFNDEEIGISGATGEPDEKGKIALRLAINPVRRSMVIESEGQVQLMDGPPSYDGTFTLRPATLIDPAGVALRDGEGKSQGAPQNDPAFSIKGDFEARLDGLMLPSFRFETGLRDNPYFADGSGKIAWGLAPRFDIEASGAQISLDSVEDQPETSGAAGLAAKVEALRSFLDKVPFPQIPGEIKLALPAIVAGNTTIRDVALSASPGTNAWRIQSLRASLPGRTKLEADGELRLGDDFGFAGKLLVASNQPSGLLKWLTGSSGDAIRRLPAVGFDARVQLSTQAQVFENMEVAIGNTKLTGRMERIDRGARPSISLALKAEGAVLEDLTAVTSFFVTPQGTNGFSGQDIDLTFSSAPLTAFGIEAEQVDAAVRLKGDRLDVDRLLVTGVGQASLSATAKLSAFPAAPQGTTDISLLTPDGAALLSMLSQRFPAVTVFGASADRAALYPDLFVDTKIDVVASALGPAASREATLSVAATSGAGIYSATGTFKGDFERMAEVAGSVNVQGRHDDPLALLALAGIATLPVGSPASVSFEIDANGSAVDGFDLNSKIRSDDLAGSFSGKFSGMSPGMSSGISGKGQLSLQSADIEPYFMAAGVAYPDMGSGLPVDLSSGFELKGATASLSSLVGSVAGTGVAADISIDRAGTIAAIGGSVTLDSLDLAWLGEWILGPGALAGDGTAWPETEFATGGIANVRGAVDLKSRIAGMRSLGEVADLRAKLVFAPDAIAMRDFAGVYLGGTLSGSLDVKNDRGTALVNGAISLQRFAAEKLVVQGNVYGVADLSGSFTGAGKTAGSLTGALSGSGTANVRELTVAGINPDGFAGIIRKVGDREKAPAYAEVQQLVEETVRQGSLTLGDRELSWTMADGIVRFSPLSAKVVGGTFQASALADLGKQRGEVTGLFGYDAGRETITGAEPFVPFTVSLDGARSTAAFNAEPMEQFLTQRALEREQARVEALQDQLLEKQRLRREARLFDYQAEVRQRMELERLRAIEEQRVRQAVRDTQRVLAEAQAKKEAEQRAKEAEAVRLEEEAMKRAAEAAASQPPQPSTAPQAPLQLELDQNIFGNSNAIGKALQDLQLDTPPLQ